MIPSWRRHHPVLAGWWIAVAQNVAPKRFHAREQRRLLELRRQVLAESGMPTYGLAGVPVDNDPSLAGAIALGTVGSSGRRGPGQGTVTSLSTSQRTAGGGHVRCTSERRPGSDSDGRQRAMLVHNFLARAGLVDDPRLERREVNFGGTRTHEVMSVPADLWRPFVVVIDGERHEFSRVTLGEDWLAIGALDDLDLAIEGHAFDADPLELVSAAARDADRSS